MITKDYTHLGLFEGIGGFSLAAHWMGWKTSAWCEWNPFGQHVLKSLFPEAEGFSDIAKTDFTKYANKIDIITGGFPCQPFSTAGKRKGTDDARYLWPEMLRAIREIRPRWVVGENVYGLVNWDGGLVFDTVCADLENEGFEVWPVVLPAAGVNAPHRRDRIWFIAHSTNTRLESVRESPKCSDKSFTSTDSGLFGQEIRQQQAVGVKQLCEEQFTPNNNRFNGNLSGFYTGEVSQLKESGIQSDTRTTGCGMGGGWTAGQQEPRIQAESGLSGCCGAAHDWTIWPTVPPLCSGDDGFSELLDADTVSEVAGKKVRNAFSWWRQESIKAGGNAIVPQVALQIFRTINEFEEGEALM